MLSVCSFYCRGLIRIGFGLLLILFTSISCLTMWNQSMSAKKILSHAEEISFGDISGSGCLALRSVHGSKRSTEPANPMGAGAPQCRGFGDLPARGPGGDTT